MSFSLDRWRGQVCIVTGASSGIGAAISEHLALNGLIVVSVARRQERLEKLAASVKDKKGILHPFRADITIEEDILKVFDWVKQKLGHVSVLVNASGVAKITANLIDGDTKQWKEIFDTNVLGLCIATREAIKSMRENNIDGHIIHINSVAGHTVPNFPRNSVYPGSKHAVTALTETLRQELNAIQSKIRITSISPGIVNTELYEAAAGGQPQVIQAVNSLLSPYPKLETSDVADAVVYVLSTPPHVQVHEIILRPVGEAV